jgi:hypothetical protein
MLYIDKQSRHLGLQKYPHTVYTLSHQQKLYIFLLNRNDAAGAIYLILKIFLINQVETASSQIDLEYSPKLLTVHIGRDMGPPHCHVTDYTVRNFCHVFRNTE